MTSSTRSLDDGDSLKLNQYMVDRLKRSGYIQNSRIEEAYLTVSRHLFLPEVPLEEVYRNQPIVIKNEKEEIISTSTQPGAIAISLALLQVKPGQRVLEIGTGSGYNAALLAHLVGESGQVVTIDLDENLVQNARKNLAEAGFERVEVVCADGSFGCLTSAPFDRIISTGAVTDIFPAWQEQLHPEGQLLLPLSLGGPQVLVAFQPIDSYFVSSSVFVCDYMSLSGDNSRFEQVWQLGSQPGLNLIAEESLDIDADTIYSWLNQPSHDYPTSVEVTMEEIVQGLRYWLALQGKGWCILNAENDLTRSNIVPELYQVNHQNQVSITMGRVGRKSLSLLMRHTNKSASYQESFELGIRNFGSDQTLATELVNQIDAWDKAGRPLVRGLRVRAFKNEDDRAFDPRALILDRHWNRFLLDHPSFQIIS
jgi:protein-L-isoaspartate(D-aspartate) O-methyltransferase